MRTSFIAQLCAALILASLFLPWFPDPFGGEIVPYRILRELDLSQIGQRFSALPPDGMAFAASFALAAVMLLLGTMGSTPRLLAILTGGMPVGLSIWALVQNYQTAQALGINGAKPDFGQILGEISKILLPGAWLWLGAGTLLLLLGLVDRRPRRR